MKIQQKKEYKSLFLTRYITQQPLISFYHPIKANLINLTMKYTRVCTNGFALGYSDGTLESFGFDGTNAVSIDVTGNRTFYSFESFCSDTYCDKFTICTIDSKNSLLIECYNSGNEASNFLSQKVYRAYNLQSLFGTITFNYDGCISNLGVTYSSNKTLNSSLSNLNLVRIPSTLTNTLSNFTQFIMDLKSLIINYDDTCITGFNFVYTGTHGVNVGSNGTNSISLDLTNSQSLYSVLSYCDKICDFMRFCSIDTKNETFVNCVDAGNFAQRLKINYFVSTKDFYMQSFYGNFLVYSGSNCLQNIGISYMF